MSPDRIATLEAENARLRAALDAATGAERRALQTGLRSTPAGHDVLFSAVEKTRMPMILTDPNQPDEPIIFANRAFQDLTGYSSEELVGRNCRFLQGPGTDRTQVAEIRAAIAENRDIAFPITNYRRDGTPFINDLYISCVYDETGRLLYRFGSQLDITPAWRTNEDLKRSESRYRTLFDTIDEGFCVIEFLDGPHGPLSDYVHLEANPAYHEHTGLPSMVGKRLRELVADEAETWLQRYLGVWHTGQPIRFEQELVATGRHLDVAAFRIEPRELRQVAVLFRDVTARRTAEIQLRQFNETLEQRIAEAMAERKILADIVESTDGFVQVVDPDLRLLAINRSAAREFKRAFGIRPIAGDRLVDLLAHLPDQQEPVLALWSRALAGEEFVETGQFGADARDRHHYEMRFGTLRNADGHRIAAYQFGYDVTGRVQEQARLVEAEEALRQSQKMEAVGQLTGGVAHDFNNLLTIIRGSVELLRRPGLPEARRDRYLDAVSETVERAARLTGQLLAFARKQALKPEVFDVVARVRGVADMVDTVTGSRVRVVADIPPGPCAVRADISQFETAIVNLAVNARDAMNGEGTLTLTVRCCQPLPAIRIHPAQDGAFTAITLADTGAGIASEVAERIFEPFFTTKEIGKGTGLGLSQVFGFAKQSGGDVDMRSELGRGTAFTLYLPEVPPDQMIAERVPAAEQPTMDLSGLCILVVEDNTEVARVAVQILQDLGSETVWAPSAEAALAELERSPRRFDVVFSDVMMPGMGGVALARELRRRWSDLPVVLTSGYSEVLAQEGADGLELLHKPYSARELVEALQRVGARSRT